MIGVNRNYLVLITAAAVCLYATIFYDQSNEHERIYHQFRGASKSDNLRSRSTTENNLAWNDLDIALSKEDYLALVDHLEKMIYTDSSNVALKYYAAILHEHQENYQKFYCPLSAGEI